MTWSRTSRHLRGYGADWDKLRKRILKRDKYLCQPCRRKGHITPADQVDHITPKAKGGDDSEANLQAICGPCHTIKTMSDQGAKPKRTYGSDGWPIS